MWIELIGYLSLALYITAYLLHKPRISMSFTTGGDAGFALYYALLGLLTPAISNACVGAFTIVALLLPTRWLKPVIGVYLLILWATAFPHVEGFLDVFPIMGYTLAGIARYGRDNFWFYRWNMVGCNALWLVFSTATQTWPMVITNILILSINAVVMGREFRKNTPKTTAESIFSFT